MKLYRLLARDGALPLASLALASLGSSLATVGLLATVNRSAREIAENGIDRVNRPAGLIFLGLLALFALCELSLLSRVATLTEKALDGARTGLVARLRRLGPEALDRLSPAALFDSMVQSSQTISQNSQFIAIVLRSAVLTVALLAYVLWLSRLAFVLVAVTCLLAGLAYGRRGRELMQAHLAAHRQDQSLFERISDQLDGWKEVRMFRPRRAAVARRFEATAAQAADMRIDVQLRGFDQYIFGQAAFYLLLGVVVFVVPAWSSLFAHDLVQIATAVLFVVAPIGLIIQALTVLAASEAAAARILALDDQLAALSDPGTEAPAPAVPAPFETIRLREAEYTYPAAAEGDRPFHLGPVSLEVRRGEILFISGGNGSGKSTLLRLLTGLSPPEAGTLEVDGQAVGPMNLRGYRSRIAAVLGDFHLFDRLYGLDHVPAELVAEGLRRFGLEGIVALDGRRFVSLALSTGQRKRLALVVALLEDRPILVLDEWAADQDPEFRRRFYRELLPELKAEGKTIVAVTHDDHYFDAADRRIHLSEGMRADDPDGGAAWSS